jgi:dTDP-4-amino-4,6-dideoxygalactose transaminase
VSLGRHFCRVPLAVPYWNGATYQRILRSLCIGRIVEGADLDDLRFQIMERLGVREAVLCGSGSLALEIALRSCEVKRGDEVVVPTFCCTAVVPPIVAVGATPVLADVGGELNLTIETVGAVLTQKTKAIIVPHLFGNPADISAIIELTRDKHVRVIDDAAQALGATLAGRPVGTFGDAGILSFGNAKVCFGLGGGVVVSRREGFLTQAGKFDLAPALLVPVLQRFLSTLIYHRWRSWTLPLQKASSRKSQDPGVLPASYLNQCMANLYAAVAHSLMQTLSENIAARSARVSAYQELLGEVAGLQLIAHGAGSACLTQVVRVLPTRNGRDLATDVIKALGRAGYEIQGSYVPIHLLENFANCVWDRLPHAERVWADLVELPCEPGVHLGHVERIATIVKETLY